MLNDSRVAPRNNSAKKCNNNEKLKKIKRRLARKKKKKMERIQKVVTHIHPKRGLTLEPVVRNK